MKFYKIEFPYGHSGQPGKAPDQVVELGKHVSEPLLEIYRAKGILVTECNEDGSPRVVPTAPGGKNDGGNGTTPREDRAAELAALDYPVLCELAKTYRLTGAGRKRTVVESEILAAEFPELPKGNG